MGKCSIFCLFFILLAGSNTLLAQDRYAIHYKYKPTVKYSLDRPEELMTPAALERREREMLAVDSTDLPVSEQYVSLIKEEVNEIIYHSKWLNASLVSASPMAIDQIRALAFVEKVELVARGGIANGFDGTKGIREPRESPISILYSDERAFEFQNNILGIPEMHRDGYHGEGIRIAVFDAGFLNADQISGLQHLFNENRILGTRNFVQGGSGSVYHTDTHGTGSLSLMAAYDPSQLVGAAYAAEYILCITEDVFSEFRIEEYNWLRAAEYADSLGVDVINSSLGYNFFDDPEMNYSKDDLDGTTAIISIAANMAAQKGILVVSSSGNEGNLSWKTITVPADAKDVVAVGAITNSLNKAGFSSTGPSSDGRIKPDLVAFGSGVTLWRQKEGTSVSSGTSFSSPQVAALAAGIWQAYPGWTRAMLMSKLLESGSQSDQPDAELGYGIPNYLRVKKTSNTGTLVERDIKIYPNPLEANELMLEFGTENNCSLKLYNTQGKMLNLLSLHRQGRNEPYRIDMGMLHPGIYWLEIEDSVRAGSIKLLKK
ncbi:Por secretion system C-terminal sorting domain-containing protein [Cyclobacterium lianum]|uniref:Por secretion system C-terminal sorting domain-containing protein n=1 Tax=Cyclobacterium lianum TaxID=388280 RepID=A0A1M7M563_9BACT|nr:S8 family peptidase [Cyclobacterium lianum]SHM85740.1 Por secretion system C-terminal sorting domain-containing protein [Cyclobacterium lianum]